MAHIDQATKDFMNKVADEHSDDLVDDAATVLRKATMAKTPAKLAVNLAGGYLANKVFGQQEKVAAKKSAMSIYSLMNDKFGREWHDWEPETLWTSIGNVPEYQKNIIMVLQVLVKTNQIHEHWHLFENAVHALNGNQVDFGMLQPCELTHIYKAIKIIKIIRPKEDFSPEIFSYIAAVAKSSGVVFLPRKMFGPMSQKFLDDLNNDLELKIHVENRWPNPPEEKDSLALKVQILRLKEIQDYA